MYQLGGKMAEGVDLVLASFKGYEPAGNGALAAGSLTLAPVTLSTILHNLLHKSNNKRRCLISIASIPYSYKSFCHKHIIPK
ncbi:hypothetical protein NKR74_12035 [Bacillus sp. 3103sda1]|uniref:hypothetical protein n=1 Tax=Bacillus sp. 3103sda1 TaxID=2953808 RepID=UPI0020A1F425|nr:hypothetical protein [Bacillus sp. 3103sda1]MCP1124038.1 hypothetical protein [Bacillus sp. 3103sda1]